MFARKVVLLTGTDTNLCLKIQAFCVDTYMKQHKLSLDKLQELAQKLNPDD